MKKLLLLGLLAALAFTTTWGCSDDDDGASDSDSDSDSDGDGDSDSDGDSDTDTDTGPATEETCLTFDDLEAITLFMEASPLKDEYEGEGVLFSGPDIHSGCAPCDDDDWTIVAHSPNNFCGFNSNTFYDGASGQPIGPQTLTFSFPVSSVSIWVGSKFSSTATLTAYDSAENEIDSDSASTSTAMVQLSVGADDIMSIVVDSPCEAWAIDDVCFVHPAE